ncbi:hypothetical protein I2I05_16555 [Hymenobacter sp. BT683]|uniref:AlgX/AlgJ SGNH hydrolase-like domain-containing protein n=1 Tax=Hymenobacter jeongseonensis TaxID=2791027 RepID=A0ABS0IMI6_9BACT|nr:hypothetical protein [Hymenobacter jeongseonensis]MBF9239015.1 hypothetical protein [Hymenobacter jeongseonensis]
MSANIPYKGKHALLVALLLMLLLPAVQAKFKVVKMDALGGYTASTAPHPELDWAGLQNNSYQTDLEHYLEARVGFREWFIRLRNQFSYTFLNVARANRVLVGRDNVLYEERPVLTYLGQDLMADSVVQHHVRRFRAVQDTLARRGKLLVFVVAPSKASFMPEYLPSYYRQQKPGKSNYQAYSAALRAAGVNFLDLSQAFRAWKDTTSHPLFPRGGIHWSSYGAKLAGDTLLCYVEKLYGHELRDFRLVPGDITREPRESDNDIAKAMNLMWPAAAYPMAYPTAVAQPLKPGQRQPNLLLIGDSFCWPIMYPFINEAFDNKQSRFWYYNTEVSWPDEHPEGRAVGALDRKQQYLSRDIIMILFTEYNMIHLDGGFSDDAYNIFTPYTRADSARIKAFETRIAAIPDLADKWWSKSAETGLSLQQLIHRQAVAQYDSIRH